MQEKSIRKRRKPNYRLRRFCALVILLALVAAAVCGGVSCCRKLKASRGGSTTYPVETPHAYTETERTERLEQLAEAYPEFEEIADHQAEYPAALLNALCNNPNMLQFAKGYLQADGKAVGGLTKSECQESFPLFLQWDARWGYVPFGDDNIGLSGCGPTCVAMAAFALTRDESMTPDKIAQAAADGGYYEAGVGTNWSFMTEGAAQFGISGKVLSLEETAVFRELEQGHPIICSMAAGDFTAHGHYILLTGTKDGKLCVNDPNCRERSKKLWDYDTLAGQVKNLWVYTAS